MLTQEQQSALDDSIQDSMRAELEKRSVLTRARAAALESVRKLYAPVVEAVSSDFTVAVQFAPSDEP